MAGSKVGCRSSSCATARGLTRPALQVPQAFAVKFNTMHSCHHLIHWHPILVCVCRSLGCTASTLTVSCAAARSGLHRYYQPYLSWYGGVPNLLGNGTVYTYVSDNGEASMAKEVRESRGFGPLCL